MRAPVELIEGRSYVFDFEAESNPGYEIEIDLEKTLPVKEIECLVGMKPLRGTCGDIQPELSVSWSVAVDQEVIASGDTSSDELGASYGSTVATTIGRIPTVKGTNYQIRLDVMRSAPELAITNPRLKVARDPLDYKYACVRASLLGHLALVILALGAIPVIGIGVRVALRSWRQRKGT